MHVNVVKPSGLCCDSILVQYDLLRITATVDTDDAEYLGRRP